jgi:hypothetical protein
MFNKPNSRFGNPTLNFRFAFSNESKIQNLKSKIEIWLNLFVV